MNVTYEVARTKDELAILALRCLEAKLYEDDGLLRNHYNVIIDKKQGCKMTIVMQLCNDRPSGAIVLFDTRHHVNTFIKPGFRNMGLGKRLVAKLREVAGLQKSLLIGTSGYGHWERFFESNWIYVEIMHFSLDEIKQWPVEKLVRKVNFLPKRQMLAAMRRSEKKRNLYNETVQTKEV